jgi:hypothetical protein
MLDFQPMTVLRASLEDSVAWNFRAGVKRVDDCNYGIVSDVESCQVAMEFILNVLKVCKSRHGSVGYLL